MKKRVHGSLMVVFGCLMLLSLIVRVQTNAATMWVIETVENTGGIEGLHASLALDSSGNPHIAYLYGTNRDLKYAEWNGTQWNIVTVDSQGYVGWAASIALDSDGNPHISYYDYGNGDLKYAKRAGSAWSITTVDSEGNVGASSFLVFDSNGNPCIGYSGSGLRIARWNGSKWNIEKADMVGGVSSFVLDSSDNPHVSYLETQEGGRGELPKYYLKYAKWNGAGWSVETVDSEGTSGADSSLVLDSSGYPHISYHDITKRNLKYAKWNGSRWNIETVDSDNFAVGHFTSLALDSNGNPCIIYTSSFDLRYARWNGSRWNIEKIIGADNPYYCTSLALDSGDNPHICYYDYVDNELMYASVVPLPTPTPTLSPTPPPAPTSPAPFPSEVIYAIAAVAIAAIAATAAVFIKKQKK